VFSECKFYLENRWTRGITTITITHFSAFRGGIFLEVGTKYEINLLGAISYLNLQDSISYIYED